MKVGISIWNGRISPVFDASHRLLVLEVKEKKCVNRYEIPFETLDPYRRSALLTGIGADVLICGAISMPLLSMLKGSGLKVFPFIAGDVEEILKVYLDDRLPSPEFLMPGCQERHRRRRGRGWARGRKEGDRETRGGEKTMKIVVTSQGKEMESPVDLRFGRAPWFIVVDMESGEFEAVSNEQNLNARQGAGIQAAETISRTGASALVTGNCGPNAFRSLQAAGIKVYTGVSGTVAQAVERFREGELSVSEGPNVQGQWTQEGE